MNIRNGVAIAAIAVALMQLMQSASFGADATVEVPVIISLTGPAAQLGLTTRMSLDVLEKVVNERGGIDHRALHFNYLDDASSPQNAVQLANQAIAAKAPVIIGPSLVATCNAVAPLVAANGPVQYCLSPGGATPKGGYSFAGGYLSRDEVQTAIRYFHDRGFTRFALLQPNDATGQSGEQAFDAAIAAYKDIVVVSREHFSPADLSEAAQLARIKAANPQILFSWVTGAPLGTVLRGIGDAGLEIPVFTSPGNMTYRAMSQFAAVIPKGGLYFVAGPYISPARFATGSTRAGIAYFVQQLQGAGLKPDAGYSSSWDIGIVVVDALRHVGANPPAERVRDYIEQLHGLAGSLGIFDFRDGSQRGHAASNIVVARWSPENAQWIAVSDPGGRPTLR